jgi:RNA polymerase sigma-70 factor, ECF subfamily
MCEMDQQSVRSLRHNHAYIMQRSLGGPRDSDYALARSAANGATAGIGDLYERHSRRVYSLCFRMTGDREEAEDLTQEVFIQLLRKIGSFRGESQFSTWLYRLTVNQVLMHIRRSTKHRQAAYDLSAIPLPRFRDLATMDRIALDAALAQLPPGCRAVFLKFVVEGYNHGEIASILGCSVGNSKSQLHKARKKLRRLLSQHVVNFPSTTLVCARNVRARLLQ